MTARAGARVPRAPRPAASGVRGRARARRVRRGPRHRACEGEEMAPRPAESAGSSRGNDVRHFKTQAVLASASPPTAPRGGAKGAARPRGILGTAARTRSAISSHRTVLVSVPPATVDLEIADMVPGNRASALGPLAICPFGPWARLPRQATLGPWARVLGNRTSVRGPASSAIDPRPVGPPPSGTPTRARTGPAARDAASSASARRPRAAALETANIHARRGAAVVRSASARRPRAAALEQRTSTRGAARQS
jgi:hypothetical protein